MIETMKAIEMLEANGFYRLADKFQNNLIKIAAFPYNLSNLDELPISARQVTWEFNKEDYDQYDDVFWTELKQRIPDYKNLPIDKDEEFNLEGELHGPDPTPGPGYVFPEATNVYPSMTGDLSYFTWDVARDSNVGPEYWKNLLPRY
jgi:hypothetical protein